MASFLNAALPSDDEEDEDFAPVLADEGEGEEAEPTDELPDETEHTRAARAARAEALWRSLARPGVPLPARGCTAERPPPRGGAARPLEPWEVELGLGQLARPGERPSAVLPRDAVTWEEAEQWRLRKRRREARARLEIPVFGLAHERRRRAEASKKKKGTRGPGDERGEGEREEEDGGTLGNGPGAASGSPASSPPSSLDLVARAKLAMAVARAAASAGGGKRTVSEVRRFAGREVVITRTLAEGELPPEDKVAAGRKGGDSAAANGIGGKADVGSGGAGADGGTQRSKGVVDADRQAGKESKSVVDADRQAGKESKRVAEANDACDGTNGVREAGEGRNANAAQEAVPTTGAASDPTASGPSPASAHPPPAGPSSSRGPRLPVGLDAVLTLLSQPKKTSTIEKTRSDWSALKSKDTSLDEELRQHARSGDAYLEQQAFLGRSEYAQYERERDARLGADARTRGRL